MVEVLLKSSCLIISMLDVQTSIFVYVCVQFNISISSCLNAEFMIMHYLTQMLHVWNIYLHLGDFWGFYVGKYSSTMVRIWVTCDG